jgi:hypothetical protein
MSVGRIRGRAITGTPEKKFSPVTELSQNDGFQAQAARQVVKVMIGRESLEL